MASMTVTVTDKTKTPRSLYDLAVNGTGNGYTVVGGGSSLTAIASVCYLSIQSSYTNGSTIVYKGNANVKNDGTRQSKELAAGDTDVHQAVQYSANLNTIFITANANNAIVNVEWHEG